MYKTFAWTVHFKRKIDNMHLVVQTFEVIWVTLTGE